MNNNNNDDVGISVILAVYWLIGGACLAAAAPWPWPANCGLLSAAFAMIALASFKRSETKYGKGPGWLGMLLFFPPLTMAIVGKVILFTVWGR